MAHAEYEVVIDRPIDEVFAFLADGLNDPKWRDGIVEIERTSDAMGVGTTYRQALKGPGGTRIQGDYFISEYELPNLLEFEVTAGPVRPTSRFDLSEEAGGTRVRSTLDLKESVGLRLMAKMINKEFDREVRQIDGLKRYLEAQPTAGQPTGGQPT